MGRRRKTKSKHGQTPSDRAKRAYQEFRPKLEALQSFDDAVKLADGAPQRTSPGRKYYLNLGSFLMGFKPPDGASHDELSLYLSLIQKMDTAAGTKAAKFQTIEENLRRAMGERT